MHLQCCIRALARCLVWNDNSNEHWNAQRNFQCDYILIGLHSDVGCERTHQLYPLSGQCWTGNRTARGHNLILMIFWLWIHFTKAQNSKTVIPTIYHVLKVNRVASTLSGRCKFTLYHITGRHFPPDWKRRPTTFRETFTADRPPPKKNGRILLKTFYCSNRWTQ
jgi:hypothetical protein